MSALRIAVGLPTLPPEARQRQALDRVVAELQLSGMDVEAFAERPRDRDGDDPFPVFHYLRVGERHRESPFDTGLYLLGRDMRAYEPPYLLMRQYPGVAWVLDPVVHHLALGGLDPWGRWDAYRDLLEEAFGPEEGVTVALTVASGWGIRSLYRRRDPVLWCAARQPAVAAATPGIRRRLEAAGARAPLIPLPAPEAPATTGARRAGRVRRIVVLTLNYAWPEPALRGLSALAEVHDELEIALCAPQVVMEAGLRFPAGAAALRERIRWLPAGDWPTLAGAVDEADVVVHLRDDPTVGERVLMEEAMGAGKPVIVLQAEDLDEYPAEDVVRVAGGRALGVSLTATLDALIEQPQLAAALGDRAREHVIGRHGAPEVARRLTGALQAAAAEGLVERPISTPAWRAHRCSAVNRCCPASADAVVGALVAERIDAAVPSALRGRMQ